MEEINPHNVEEVTEVQDTSVPQKKTVNLSRLNLALSLLSLALIATGTYYGWDAVAQYRNTDPQIDGYVQPRSIANLVDLVQESTVTIYCDYGAVDVRDQGTGWAINIVTDREKEYPTALITNHHVIENCLDGKGQLSVEALGGKEFPAIIDNWDIENDLAVIATKLKLDPLPLSENPPYPGYWVMALGTADGFEGSVAFGNVLNSTDTEVFITAAVSHGNSGGPLIDNEGKVIGTNSWSRTGEQYNGAKSLDAMCAGVMVCDGKSYWDWGD